MIFARVDVTLGQHHRVLRIHPRMRAEAMGVWLLALLYTRGHDLDGFCPDGALSEVSRSKVVEELVSVGLLSREVDSNGVHGVRVLRYAEHNETKEDVKRRRAITNERVRRYRSETKRVTHALAPDSDSDSVFSLSPKTSNAAAGSSKIATAPSALTDSLEGTLTGSDFEDERQRQVKTAESMATGPGPAAAFLTSSAERKAPCKRHHFAEGACIHCGANQVAV